MKLKTTLFSAVTYESNPEVVNIMDIASGDDVVLTIQDLVYITMKWQEEHGDILLPTDFSTWKGVEGKAK